ASRRGVAATLFAALAKASVNIRAIAQGCSEYNITVLIDGSDATKALRAVHGRFYLDALPLGIGLVGRGLIGSALLQQLEAQRETLLETHRLDVRVLGVASSSKMLVDPRGLDLKNWQAAFEADAQPLDLQAFGLLLAGSGVPNMVVVDCTASDEPPAMYAEWMRQGLHVVTPNKRLNSGPLPRHEYIRARARESYIHYLYEATVGAGLPVVATLQHLVASGDRVRRIEGIFSGTLSFLFNSFAPQQEPFSAVVAQARANGFTEPDPRDDLGGQDVARKVVILARECGIDLELSDVDLVSLVPEPLRDASAVSPEEFMRRLPEFDSGMAELAAQAEAQGECLRFVGVVDVEQGKGSVELRRYPRQHAFAQLSGSDNIIAFHTARYDQQPLIVRGPGAGAEVTAGGVFSDLLRLAAYVGAPS
ncbi:homoserine dehydrogenase, partial [Helicosporidium sp. ATCC 50920]